MVNKKITAVHKLPMLLMLEQFRISQLDLICLTGRQPRLCEKNTAGQLLSMKNLKILISHATI